MISSQPPPSGIPGSQTSPSSAVAGVPSGQFAQLFAQLTTALNALDTDSRANASLISSVIGDAITALAGNYETGSWTPNLTFGGASTGIAYLYQVGLFTRTYRTAVCLFGLALTAVGSATGAAQIETLPFSSNANQANLGAGGVCSAYANMIGLAAAPLLSVGPASARIAMNAQAATGSPALTNTSFTNTTSLGGAVVFLI